MDWGTLPWYCTDMTCSYHYGSPTTGNAAQFNYNLLVNATAPHAVGSYMNMATNAILRTIKPKATIVTHNYPLPLTDMVSGSFLKNETSK